MADVYLAMVGGPVAGFVKLAVVKKIRRHLAEDAEFVAMMLEEARVSARLNHPNVVQVHEVGVEAGQHFLAMEYLDGQPLHRVLHRASKAEPKLSKDAVYLVVADALRGLHYAHELTDFDGTAFQIVHRDVNPQNVFITYDGQVKIVDFGIAKARGRANETRQGLVRGKIRYMSPEQALGRTIDRRTDIFAAGIMLWQAATSRRFWGTLDDESVMRSLTARTYNPSPRSVDDRVPEEIDAICRKALAPHAADRYGTAAEMLSELETFLGDREVEARRALVATLGALFARERAELRATVEAEAGPVSMTSSMGAMALSPIPEPPEAIQTETRPFQALLEIQRSFSPPPPRSRAPRIAASVVLVSVLATVAAVAGPSIVAEPASSPRAATEVASDDRCAFSSDTARSKLASKVSTEDAGVRAEPAPTVAARPPPPPGRWRPPPPRPGDMRKPRPKPGALGLDTTDPWR
jgi:serine/threonine-protein kinase